MAEVQVILKSRTLEKHRLLSALASFAKEQNLPPAAVNAADLALEEHLTNVMNYGYDGSGEHDITVRLSTGPGEFMIEVVDDGKPFNPLDRPPVDTTKPLDQKPIGGLGIHLICQFMDKVEYLRESGKNILTMRKRLPKPAGE